MSNNSKTTKAYLKQAKVVRIAYIIVLLIGLLVAFTLRYYMLLEPNQSTSSIFFYFAPAFSFIAITVAYVIHPRKIKSIKKEESLANKLEVYKELYISKLSVFEGIGIFTIIAYALTYHSIHLILLAAVVVIILINGFSLRKAIHDLVLTQKEQTILNDKSTVLQPRLEGSLIKKNPWIIVIIIPFLTYLVIDSIKGLI